jgi:3-oxoacyl-[acyl-carrier protein] reductase
MDFGLAGKRALVFGGSRGLGRATAAALAAEGAQVAVVARDPARLQAAAADIGAAWALPGDCEAPGASAAMVHRVIGGWGGVDVLVVNTGGPPAARFADVTPAMWQQGFQALWLSAVEAIQAALPGMIERRWGRVLLVTSVAAQEPMARLTLSNGLRAGLLNLCKSLSDEVAEHGITVNALLPGYTRTERMAELGVTDAQVAAQVPARRLGEPAEFGALAAFLASRPAAYITGQAIAADGGWLRGH